jgi:8-oxo-dGTP pyrophosphatase MutT (NUDIX family)
VAASELVKEATSSSVVVHYGEDQKWRAALIFHVRLGGWLLNGGHVEAWETCAQAAVRETAEECGLHGRLLSGPALSLPDGFVDAVEGCQVGSDGRPSLKSAGSAYDGSNPSAATPAKRAPDLGARIH